MARGTSTDEHISEACDKIHTYGKKFYTQCHPAAVGKTAAVSVAYYQYGHESPHLGCKRRLR